MNKELLEKFCNNRCTEGELSSVLEWLNSSARTPEGKNLLFEIWEALPEGETNLQVDFDFILDKIHHKVNLGESRRLLEEADQDIIRYRRKKNIIDVLLRAAAILILPILSFGIYMTFKYQSTRHDQISVNQSYNEVFSLVDAITKVSLPDGSNVWLNHSSSLKYPARFHGNTRAVELSGEGYFEVAHNPKIPFVVSAGELQIKALGTTFNILAYPDEDRIETSLITGCVDLERRGPDGKAITLLKMRPSDLVIFQRSKNEISTRTIYDDRYFSWKEGRLVFNEEPMDGVVRKLSRWYNVDIQIKDPELLELTYTATFVHETLPQVMELIAKVSPVCYSISDRKEISPGTFDKRKVILRYRNN